MEFSDTSGFRLAADLPPGRVTPSASPVLWLSDTPIPDPAAWWARCQKQVQDTGLRPVLYSWPSDPHQPQFPDDVSESQLDADLEATWCSYRALQLRQQAEPYQPYQPPEGLMDWEDDPGPPYDRCPGLAPAGVATGISDPDDTAQLVIEKLTASHHGLKDAHLALVPAAHSGDIPAVMGWPADAPRASLCTMLRSWEGRFGTRVVAIQGAMVYVSVARPPQVLAHATHIALEHVLTGADNINDGTPFPRYAESLIGTHLWSFWWD
ncbi:DUF4253 domain-containing protein [Streptacidiphilus sp. PAMC 29251]